MFFTFSLNLISVYLIFLVFSVRSVLLKLSFVPAYNLCLLPFSKIIVPLPYFKAVLDATFCKFNAVHFAFFLAKLLLIAPPILLSAFILYSIFLSVF